MVNHVLPPTLQRDLRHVKNETHGEQGKPASETENYLCDKCKAHLGRRVALPSSLSNWGIDPCGGYTALDLHVELITVFTAAHLARNIQTKQWLSIDDIVKLFEVWQRTQSDEIHWLSRVQLAYLSLRLAENLLRAGSEVD
ncbi:hypothetical protein AYM40_06930 [Paraburkholderia phytofirmans OLGA172]|uniref:Uncharacterized protein n=2 Tax=Paraburkholderia phytofirmans TaxID=261302 RepID=A0A160FJ14_9BURK|nr:hypothetical protein AYM40_06930 [Paraburkholderia phytofirmans OLGA172]